MKKFTPISKVELRNEEINAALEVLKSGNLRQGKKTEEFEKAFAKKVGAKYAIAVSSGTAALHVSYTALINPGDEVLVPSFTHISTASMVCFAGGKPVFCDVDSKTFTIDLEEIERKTTSKTKAVAAVHLFGNACYIDEIIKIAEENGLKIIWDAAQAHGTKYKGKDVGSFDDLVCYSFYPTKNMITGEGGMVTTNSHELYEKIRLLRSHGQTKKYFHTNLGFNYRMTDIEAAIGVEQLSKLNDFIAKRKTNAEHLTQGISEIDGIITPFTEDFIEHSYHQYTVLLNTSKLRCTRDDFITQMTKEGIGTAVHYPRPLDKQPIFEAMYGVISLPTCENISNRILSLPIYPGLNVKELENITYKIKKIILKQ